MSTLPKPPRDVPMDRDLSKLAPGIRRRVEKVVKAMEARGHDPIVVEAFRTDARQTHLFGFGRKYDDGRGIVTKAPDASRTQHGYGLAVDIISRSKGYNAPAAFWAALAEEAERVGMAAGLRWKFKDSPHIQVGAPAPVSPTAQDRADRKAGNLRAVWARYGVDT
jgi:peptidoglycan LD-endopeptidase CwlK